MVLKYLPTQSWQRLPRDGQLSMGVAAGCFVTASVGSLVNLFILESLSVAGMAVVGCFYLLLGISSVAQSKVQRATRRYSAQAARHPLRISNSAGSRACAPRNRCCQPGMTRTCNSLNSDTATL